MSNFFDLLMASTEQTRQEFLQIETLRMGKHG